MVNYLKIFKQYFRRFRRVQLGHPFAVPFITLGILLFASGGVYLIARQTNHLPVYHDAKIVIVKYDHQQQIVPSKEATVGSLLTKLHIKLHKGDVVEPATNTRIDQDQFRINVYRAVPVQIIDGGHKVNTFSAAKTPRAIAQQAGSSLYPEDVITTLPSNNFLSDGTIGEQVVITRSTPVNVDLYGTKVVIRTQAKTISGLIKEKHIKLIKNDKLSPAADTPITANQQIAFIRTGTKVETITEDIATPIQKINDPSLAYGTSAVRQAGTPGQQVVTYQVEITNNIETKRTIIQKIVTRQPVTQIVVAGSAVPSADDVKGQIVYWAQQYGVDPNYLLRVAKCESNFHTNSVNPSGAYGLFQYKTTTWASYSASAGIGGASIWDGNAQSHTTAWAFAHGKSSAWSCA